MDVFFPLIEWCPNAVRVERHFSNFLHVRSVVRLKLSPFIVPQEYLILGPIINVWCLKAGWHLFTTLKASASIEKFPSLILPLSLFIVLRRWFILGCLIDMWLFTASHLIHSPENQWFTATALIHISEVDDSQQVHPFIALKSMIHRNCSLSCLSSLSQTSTYTRLIFIDPSPSSSQKQLRHQAFQEQQALREHHLHQTLQRSQINQIKCSPHTSLSKKQWLARNWYPQLSQLAKTIKNGKSKRPTSQHRRMSYGSTKEKWWSKEASTLMASIGGWVLFQCHWEADFAIGRFLVEKHVGQQTVQGYVPAANLRQLYPATIVTVEPPWA